MKRCLDGVPMTVKDEGYLFNDLSHNLASNGSLDPGEYRIVKKILDFRSTGDTDQYTLAAEFTIF